MKIYYCVTTSFDDNGRVTVGIPNTIQAESKPKSTFISTRRKDIYIDWFDSLKEAREYVNIKFDKQNNA